MKIRLYELRKIIKEALGGVRDHRHDPYRMGSFVEEESDDEWWEQKEAEYQRELELGPDATDADYFGLTDEEVTPPGKWHPSSGESVDADDLRRLGEVDSPKDDARRPNTNKKLTPRRGARANFDNNSWKEPECLDCGLPGSDCACEPRGRFE